MWQRIGERHCCHSGCLLRRGPFQTRIITRAQRNTVYQKSYNEQKYLFSKLMDIRVTVGGNRRVTYTIPPLGKVCRTAFRKSYGLSENKIGVLLKKIHLNNPSVEPDQRGQRTAILSPHLTRSFRSQEWCTIQIVRLPSTWLLFLWLEVETFILIQDLTDNVTLPSSIY